MFERKGKRFLEGKAASVVVILVLLGGTAIMLLPMGESGRKERSHPGWDPRTPAGRPGDAAGSREAVRPERTRGGSLSAQAPFSRPEAVRGEDPIPAATAAGGVPLPQGLPSSEEAGEEGAPGGSAGPLRERDRLSAARRQGFFRRAAGRIGSALSRAAGRSPSRPAPLGRQADLAPRYDDPSMGERTTASASGAGPGGGGESGVEQEPPGTHGSNAGLGAPGTGEGGPVGPGAPPGKDYNIPDCLYSDGTRCGALTCAVELFHPIEKKIRTGLRRQFEGGKHVMELAKEDVPKIAVRERQLREHAGRLSESSCTEVSKVGREAQRWLDGILDDLDRQGELLARGIWDCHGPQLGRSLNDPCGVSGLRALQAELEMTEKIEEASTDGVVREHHCGPSETAEQDCAQDVRTCRQFVRDFHSEQSSIYKDGARPDLDPNWCDRYPHKVDKIGYDMICHACRCVLGRVRWSRDRIKEFAEACSVFSDEIPQVMALLPPLPREINRGQKLLNNTCKDIPPGNRNQSYFQGITELQRVRPKLTRVLLIFEQLRAAECGDKVRDL